MKDLSLTKKKQSMFPVYTIKLLDGFLLLIEINNWRESLHTTWILSLRSMWQCMCAFYVQRFCYIGCVEKGLGLEECGQGLKKELEAATTLWFRIWK